MRGTDQTGGDAPMVTMVMAALVAWFVLSVPVAVLVGALLGGQSRIRVQGPRRLSLG